MDLNGDCNMIQLVSSASWHHRQYLNLSSKSANNGDMLVTYTVSMKDLGNHNLYSKRWRRSLPTEKSSLHIQPTARNPALQRGVNIKSHQLSIIIPAIKL